jgi:hypothetical protein
LSTINKNVGCINYIYYNQQRFVNYTRDAVKEIAELGPTSKMAWENQMALDMILAEKSGGMCPDWEENVAHSSITTQLQMGP